MSYTKQGDFVRIIKGTRGAKQTDHMLTASITSDYGNGKTESAHRRINFRIQRPLLDELGWEIGEYVEVHEGKGSSAGKLLIVQAGAPDTGYKLSSTAGRTRGTSERKRSANGLPANAYTGFNTTLLVLHETPDESVPAGPVRYRVFNGELLIDMPEWFKPIAATAEAQPAKRRYQRKQDTA